jgi:hypothetical protein
LRDRVWEFWTQTEYVTSLYRDYARANAKCLRLKIGAVAFLISDIPIWFPRIELAEGYLYFSMRSGSVRPHNSGSVVAMLASLALLSVAGKAERASTRPAFHQSPCLFFCKGFSHLEHWASVHFLLGHKLNSHTPSSASSQQLPKLL